MKNEIEAKIQELLENINSNLEGERFAVSSVRGKVKILVFADPESPAFEEFIKQRLSQPSEKQKTIKQIRDLLEKSIDIRLSGDLSTQSLEESRSLVRQADELQRRVELEIEMDKDPPLGQVAQILNKVGNYCDKHYKNPDKLLDLLNFLIANT